ncbi:MAG: DUF1697 domain-containing protein [Caulobacterales bacterium]|nr:DUF1697 domain-containing protein [Caulobacterales bacterium]
MTGVRIVLFRGMNTGGVRASVAAQKAMALDLGLDNPRTLLASGNLVVNSDRAPAELEDRIEAATECRFGRRIETLVRTGEQWSALMAANPFVEQSRIDPSRVVMMVMKAGVKPGGLEALTTLAADGEKVLETADTLWFWHPDGIGRSRMAAKAQPRLIGTGTGRNWSTVVKIAASAGIGEDR